MSHNRWHPDIAPIATVAIGEPLTLDVPLGTGGQLDASSTHEDLLTLSLDEDLLVGPVAVAGAEPGDILAIDILDVTPGTFGFSAVFPGFGFLSDLFPDPYLVTWEIAGGYARSSALPGVRIPGSPFPGTIGVAPSITAIAEMRGREHALSSSAGIDLASFDAPAVPDHASDGLGMLPPREFGGNLDIRHLGAGARLFLRVHTSGALLSIGDIHFAQGEGEMCGSAIETSAQVTLRFDLVKSPRWTPRLPAFEAPAEAPRRHFATTGIPLADDGTNEFMDLALAARRALVEMVDYLVATYGFEREAAYVLTSVAGQLRVSQVVDVPNALVSLLMPVDVFDSYRSPA